MSKSVAAVVVTYNRKNLLSQALQSLLDQTVPLAKIIIVDNASNDGTFEHIKQLGLIDHEAIEYFKLETNTGGAGGFRFGLKQAYDLGHEWVWLMDDDVLADQNCLEKLLEITEITQGKYKIIQANRVDMDSNEPFKYTTQFNFKNPFKLETVKEINPNQISADYHPIVSFPFEGPMIHREVITNIGEVDDTYFIICDDADYAIRANRKGFKAVVARNAILRRFSLHNNKKQIFDWKDYYMVRNRIELDRRYGGNYIFVSRTFVQFMKLNIRLLKRINRLRFREYILLLKAFKDGLTNIRGKTVSP
ncbi:glycosyltransferase [Cohnella xylanilytica]|uniref:Glycosyltransferase n=1 Tax=Cohnella xylanilytica TaxID=557555 RepID=A0A841TXF2_9BACL|nr:glycosyltransferase [Cohnella xylanilytica]MBB6693247.1 glycosyltransferase [Cohnella xylanilytica]